MDTLSSWLRRLGLDRYASVLAEQEVDLEALRLLTEKDLQELGLPLGPRKKLLKALADLECDDSPLASASVEVHPTSTPAEASSVPAVHATGETGERRQLTVLFCDMVGFTELANRVDPEVLQGIIRSYEDACAVCITRYEGYVFQRLGDGIVAFFGYPLAHEGEAERAIHAGLEIIESLSKLDVPDAGHLAGAHRHRHRAGGGVLGREGRGGRDDESGLPAARHRPARQHRGERAGASPGRWQPSTTKTWASRR